MFGVMCPNRTFRAAFWDGFTSPALLFTKVERPGSSSAVLDELTKPDFLAVFAETHPIAHGLLLDLKEKEHKRDVVYATILRINGIICLLATIAALYFVALRW